MVYEALGVKVLQARDGSSAEWDSGNRYQNTKTLKHRHFTTIFYKYAPECRPKK